MLDELSGISPIDVVSPYWPLVPFSQRLVNAHSPKGRSRSLKGCEEVIINSSVSLKGKHSIRP